MSQSTRAQLEALRDSLIESGSRRTSAQDVRDMVSALIESLTNILDDKDATDGYLGIDSNDRVDVTKITAATPSGKFLQDDGTWADVPEANPNLSLFDRFVSRGNAIATGETQLYLETINANTLANDGDKLFVEWGIKLRGGAATKRIRLKFDGNTIYDSGNLAIASDTDVVLRGFIIRADAVRLRYVLNIPGGVTRVDELTPVDFTQPNDLLLTGDTSTGSDEADDDVQAILGTVKFVAAAS